MSPQLGRILSVGVDNWATIAVSSLLLFLGCATPFGVFVPGGSILVLALGVLAGNDTRLDVELWLALGGMTMLGQWAGYFWGRRLGRLLEQRVPPALLVKIRLFMRRYGRWAVVTAPWLPFVRNLAPFVIGAEEAPAGPYMFWSAVAAWLWVGGLRFIARLARAWIEALTGL